MQEDKTRGGSLDPSKAIPKTGGLGAMSADKGRTADHARLCEFLVTSGGRWPRVFLDGVEQKHVVLVDQAAGMVRRFVVDNGALQLKPDGESILTEDVFGDVVVEPGRERKAEGT